MIHKLKTIQPYFDDVCSCKKTFEIRFNDRNFKVGDDLILQEYVDGEYTGLAILKHIIYMTDYEQKEGYVVLGIKY